jgi:hypothetical protein
MIIWRLNVASSSRGEAGGCGPRLRITIEKCSVFVDPVTCLLRMIGRNVGGG